MQIDKNELLELEILRQVEESPRQNTRVLAAKLGCNVRLTHSLVSRLVARGMLEVRKLHHKRWDYFLTPQGIVEKMRRTYHFFEFSMQFYQEARARSSRICGEISRHGYRSVDFVGAGELAEIVFIGLTEHELSLAEVFSDVKDTFIGRRGRPSSHLQERRADAVIVCLHSVNCPEFEAASELCGQGVYWVYPSQTKFGAAVAAAGNAE